MNGASESQTDHLTSAWRSDRRPFSRWVRTVASAHEKGSLTLEAAASHVGSTPAEFEAVLQLSLLEDSELDLLEDAPPKTTWFLFAAASAAGIRAGVDALRIRETSDPYLAVSSAISAIEGPGESERVTQLRWETFAHAAKKAKQYGQLREKDIKALRSFSSRKRGGKSLTSAQVAYAAGMLRTLADGGAITRESVDGDQVVCDEILDALGRP